MYQKLLELKNKRAELLSKGKQLIAEGKYDEHKALLEGDVAKINNEIEGVEKQMAEEGRFADNDQRMIGLYEAQRKREQDEQLEKSVDAIRGSNEYARAFAKAMRHGATVKLARGNEAYAPLYKALTIGGGDPAGSDGGFLVPVEFDNAIVRAAKDYLDLSELFHVERVTTATGWRAVETGVPKALPNIDEMGTIGKDDQPVLKKVAYSVKKFGDRLPISNELLEDETAGLLQYVADWFAPKYVLTKNALLIPMLTGLTKSVALTEGSEDKLLRQAMVKELNTAHSRAATLLTNQTGFAAMDGWEDKDGRALLTPDATAAAAMRYRGRSVVYGDDSELPGSAIYVGNFKSLGTLFERKGIEMAATNVGGDAWATDSSEVRVICRMDAQTVNADAAFKATIG